MAPLKQIQPTVGNVTTRATKIQPLSISTRSRAPTISSQNRTKRKADFSPVKDANVKRTAMGDITNAKKVTDDKKKLNVKQPIKKVKAASSIKTVKSNKQNENIVPPPAPCINGVTTRASLKNHTNSNQTAIKPKEPLKEINVNKVKTRLSNEFEKTTESLYSSALEDLINDGCNTTDGAKKETKSLLSEVSFSSASGDTNLSSVTLVAQQLESILNLGNHEVPENVDDYDKENWDDVFQVSHYAMDIFNYLKSKEPQFDISDYMERQVCLTTWMRSLLVDWMVEVQESFELNHETLYLGVKLVDMYLSKMTVGKDTLQLVGAASMFVASKYDERMPPFIDDFLYICDGAYTRRELIRMEINLLKVCNFNLGIPLSYRFLRRYARCAKITMPLLTLARYILEYSLMDYNTVTVRDSKLAAGALYLALRMKKVSGWTPALEFYSGYKLEDIMNSVVLLNSGLHKKQKSPLMTVKNKYSHKIFFEVAKTPLLTNDELKL